MFFIKFTNALTGIMMAYEVASGEELSEEQKEAAVEELVTTGELAVRPFHPMFPRNKFHRFHTL